MAIKFEDRKSTETQKSARKAASAEVEARPATPVDKAQPLDPDTRSELPFGKPSQPEKKRGRR